MASDINRVILIGRLTRDPELKSTNGGNHFCRFSLASNYSHKKQDGSYEDKPNFLECIAWGKQAETIHKYVSKGNRIAIEGRLSWSSWEHEGKTRSKIEVVVEQFNFLEKRDGNSSGGAAAFDSGAMQGDDDIPF